MAGFSSYWKLVNATILVSILLTSSALYAETSQTKGDASLRVEYQYIRTGAFDSSVGEIDIGNTDSHVILLSGDYALNDRWKVMASLPYIQKRHIRCITAQPRR